MNDVIEHIDRETGLKVLPALKRIAPQQIVIFTPLGYTWINIPTKMSQDQWGMGGAEWQKHRSGWHPEDFPTADGWTIVSCRISIRSMDTAELIEQPVGALPGPSGVARSQSREISAESTSDRGFSQIQLHKRGHRRERHFSSISRFVRYPTVEPGMELASVLDSNELVSCRRWPSLLIVTGFEPGNQHVSARPGKTDSRGDCLVNRIKLWRSFRETRRLQDPNLLIIASS